MQRRCFRTFGLRVLPDVSRIVKAGATHQFKIKITDKPVLATGMQGRKDCTFIGSQLAGFKKSQLLACKTCLISRTGEL